MRVAQVIGTYEYGGIGSIITNIAKGLEKKGIDAEIVCVRQLLNPKNIKVAKFGSKLYPTVFWGTLKMLNYLKGFDVIHVHGSLPILFALFKNPSNKIIYTHHGWHIGVKETEFRTKIGSALFLKLYQLLSSKVDVFIGISKWSQKEIKIFFNRESYLLRNPIDEKRFKPRPNVKKFRIGDPTILSIGRNWPHKGHKYEIISMKEIIKIYPNARLLLVGKGNEKLLPLINRLSLRKYVQILPFVEDRNFPYLYNSADVYVTASFWELFGLTILEALFSGTPVVGRRAFAITELLEESGAGKLFVQNDEIPDAILEVLTNRERYTKKAIEFRRKYLKQNNWEKYINRLIKIYENS